MSNNDNIITNDDDAIMSEFFEFTGRYRGMEISTRSEFTI